MKFFKNIIEKFAGKPVDWDELEESLIRSDIGVPMTLRIIQRLQERDAHSRITANDISEVARDEIGRVLPINPPPIRPLPAHPKVILIVGVNGTGKTTSTAKLAHFFKANRHTVLLAAADTFRAAAIEQLAIWAERIGVEMIRGQYNADPAALCYEAYVAAQKRNAQSKNTAQKLSLSAAEFLPMIICAKDSPKNFAMVRMCSSPHPNSRPTTR